MPTAPVTIRPVLSSLAAAVLASRNPVAPRPGRPWPKGLIVLYCTVHGWRFPGWTREELNMRKNQTVCGIRPLRRAGLPPPGARQPIGAGPGHEGRPATVPLSVHGREWRGPLECGDPWPLFCGPAEAETVLGPAGRQRDATYKKGAMSSHTPKVRPPWARARW